MTTDQASLSVGARLVVGKHSAQIRYLGPVDGQDGQWVGLEWDDPSRGKHDGTHDGRRYFTCSKHQQAGSFVRLPKLLETADLGRSLESAIQSRYKSSTDDVAEINEDAYVSTASRRRVPIRLVGAAAAADAVCADGALHQASFVGMRISSLEPTPKVVSFLSKVAVLDLSENLIGRWGAVAALITALPSLHTLSLCGNLLDLKELFYPSPHLYPSVESHLDLVTLQTLVLNSCRVTWAQAVAVAGHLPNLSALHLCRNGINALETPANDCLCKLQTLDLEENNLEDWIEVASSLKDLPALHTLLLGGNSLTQVTYPGSGFSSLKRLMLGTNKLGKWSVADELDKFPVLEEVRLSNNPFLAATAAPGTAATGAQDRCTEENSSDADIRRARFEIIARISKLKVLNGGDIGPAERWDSELAYLRQVTDAAAAAGEAGGAEAREVVLDANPKFGALIGKYGEPTASGPSPAKGTTLASVMVELLLVAGKKQVKKKVPASLTIGRLKPLLERLLRIKVGHQTICLVNPLGTSVEDVTSHDGKELRFYEVADGWKVQVGERDVAAVAAAQDAAVAEQERRMDEHERGLRKLRDEEQRLMVG